MKRPIGVWVITLWIAFGTLIGFVNKVLIYKGILPAGPTVQKMNEDLGFLGLIINLVFTVLHLTSMFYFFKLSKKASALFLTAVILGAIHALYLYYFTDWVKNISPKNVPFMQSVLLFGTLSHVAIYFYMKYLEKKGILT